MEAMRPRVAAGLISQATLSHSVPSTSPALARDARRSHLHFPASSFAVELVRSAVEHRTTSVVASRALHHTATAYV